MGLFPRTSAAGPPVFRWPCATDHALFFLFCRNAERQIARTETYGARQQQIDGNDAQHDRKLAADRTRKIEEPDNNSNDSSDDTVSCSHVFLHNSSPPLMSVFKFRRRGSAGQKAMTHSRSPEPFNQQNDAGG